MNYKAVLAGLAAALLAAGCAAGVTGEGDSTEEVITPVSVLTTESASITSKAIYAGQITARESVNVSSKIVGKVKDVFFDIGDTVRNGDVLFTLDEIDLQNQIRQLEGQLNIAEQAVKTAENALSAVTGGQFSSQIMSLETAVTNAERAVETATLSLQNADITLGTAQDALNSATTSYNNARVLYAAGSASKSDFDAAELGYQKAQAGLESASVAQTIAKVNLEQAQKGLIQAQENLNLTLGEIKDENLQKARLGVNQAVASREEIGVRLEIARDTLNDISITAPMDGIVSARNVKPAEFTSTQVAAFSLVDIETVSVSVKVSEQLINLLQPGQSVELYVNTVSNEPITGRIASVAPAADPTNTYPVKIEIPNPGQLMKPGMFAEAHFVRAASEGVIVMPRNTVLEDERGRYVYTASGDVAVKTPVETGIDNGYEIEILSGLSLGERVIIKGHDYVNDGDKILIVE